MSNKTHELIVNTNAEIMLESIDSESGLGQHADEILTGAATVLTDWLEENHTGVALVCDPHFRHWQGGKHHQFKTGGTCVVTWSQEPEQIKLAWKATEIYDDAIESVTNAVAIACGCDETGNPVEDVE